MSRPDDPHRPRSTDPLVDAAWAGAAEVVAERLAAGDDPNARDDRGTTPLGAATRRHHHGVMRILLAAGADPNVSDNPKKSLLATAVGSDAIGVRLLLDAGANPNNLQDRDGYSDLMQAVGADNYLADANLPKRIAIVRMLIEAGADVNFRGWRGYTALSETGGEDELVRILLEAGAVIPPSRAGDEPLLMTTMGYGFRGRPSREAGICRLIAAGADVQSSNEFSTTPLKWACNLGSHRVVAALLEAGAKRVGGTGDPYSRRYFNPWCIPELHLAARSGNSELVRLLLGDGADANEPDQVGQSPLYRAAERGRTGAVCVLLDAGADPNAPSDRGLNGLRVAALGGQVGCVDLLLGAGAEVDAANGGGVTALHLAALWHRKAVVARLIAAGADPGRPDAAERTPLMWALERWGLVAQSRRWRRTLAVAGMLLDAGADATARDHRGRSALHAAARGHWYDGDRPEVARRLLDAGADPDAADEAGSTPLHEATAAAMLRVAGVLLDAGADPNRPDHGGETALHRFLRWSLRTEPTHYRTQYPRWTHRPLLDRLLGAGADVNRADASGVTPFMLAARNRGVDLITPLLQAGADPSLRDRDGRMAQDHARLAGPLPPDLPSDESSRVRFLCMLLRAFRARDGAAGREGRRIARRESIRKIRDRRESFEAED